MSALYTETSGLLEIKNQSLNQEYINAFIDTILDRTFDSRNIHTILLDNVELDDIESYDIFMDFVNIKELKIVRSTFTSKQLTNLLNYINPYSLSNLDLSESMFVRFDETDFIPINSLFQIKTLILPDNMVPFFKKVLKGVLDNY
jgi:hypothetical protein